MNYLSVLISSCVVGSVLLMSVSKKRREAAKNYVNSTIVHLKLAVYMGHVKANLPHRFELYKQLFTFQLEQFYTEKKVSMNSIAWMVRQLNFNLLQQAQFKRLKVDPMQHVQMLAQCAIFATESQNISKKILPELFSEPLA